jgi:hypothetical protein
MPAGSSAPRGRIWTMNPGLATRKAPDARWKSRRLVRVLKRK